MLKKNELLRCSTVNTEPGTLERLTCTILNFLLKNETSHNYE